MEFGTRKRRVLICKLATCSITCQENKRERMALAYRSIGLTGKPGSAAVQRTLASLAAGLRARGVELCVDRAIGGESDDPVCNADEIAARADLVVCIGGDGTLLHAARRYALDGLPLVGVNIGRLGFLVDVAPDEIEARLDELLAGGFIEERRLMLEMEASDGDRKIGHGVAFNDVVVHKADPSRMLEFSTYVDATGITTHRADGLIVATPTGSTAYALSGGGPILHPSMDAIVMVPICPHTLSDRPLVVPAQHRITLTIAPETGSGQVSCDGQPSIQLPAGARVGIQRCAHPVRLLHPPDYDYYHILRNKLHWGRDPGIRGGE